MTESVQPLLIEAEKTLRTVHTLVDSQENLQAIGALSQYAAALTGLATAKHELRGVLAKEDAAAERQVQSRLDAEPVSETSQ